MSSTCLVIALGLLRLNQLLLSIHRLRRQRLWEGLIQLRVSYCFSVVTILFFCMYTSEPLSLPLTGEGIIAFATVTESNTEEEDELVKELRLLVREEIGPFAAPDIICITPSLPMVRLFYFASPWCCCCCSN